MYNLKTCSDCGEIKEESNFYFRSKNKQTRKSYCKACATQRSLSYNKEHPQDPEKRKIYRARYYQKNKSVILKKNSSWSSDHKHLEREYGRSWYVKNRDKERIRLSMFRALHPNVKRRESAERRAKIARTVGKFQEQDIQRLYILQKGKCAACRIGLRRYHIDHIIPISRGGSNWPTNLQLLCPSCNQRKWAKDPIEFAKEIGLLI